MSFNHKTIEELHDLLVSKEISATELADALDTNSRELLSWLGETKRQKKELRRKFEKYMGDDGKAYIRRKGAQD